MGIWLNILVSLATGLFLLSSAQADETAKRIQSAIEKIEAARKLEAFLAFTLQVQDEKLPR